MPLGIPHSHFLGGPAGWTAADREKALRWQRRERERHADCGFRVADWTDPDGEVDGGAWHLEDSYCPACAVRDSQSQDEKRPPGVYQRWVRSDVEPLPAE